MVIKKNIFIFFISVFVISIFAPAEATLSLESFLRQFQEKSLDLKVELAELDAAKAKAIGIKIPPPQVGFIQMRDQMESTQGFEISQDIPFPGKIASDKSARNNQAKAHFELHALRRSEIMSEAKLVFIQYWLSFEKLKVLNERKKIIEDHIKLSRAGVRSDSSMKIHLLKSESDLDFIENDIEEAKQQIVAMKFKIAFFLNLPEAKVDSIPYPQEPNLSPIPNNLETETHQLKMAQFELQSLESQESEAKQAWFPDFNIRYKEMNASSVNTKNSEVTLGITLPFLFPWDPNSLAKNATAEKMRAEFRLEKTRRDIESTKGSFISRAQSLKVQMENLNNKLLPRANKRMLLIHNIAPRDMESLVDHREAMENFTDLKTKVLQLREEYEKAVSELEKYKDQSGETHD